MARFFHPLLHLLASATKQQLLAQVQYLKAENEILRRKLPKRITVTPQERARLVRLGLLVGAALGQLISIVSLRTFRRWAKPERGGKSLMKKIGRPRTAAEIEEVILRLARDTGWGYTRILGELRKLRIHGVSRSTVVNILRRNGLDPGPQRGEGTWHEFVRVHAHTLWACDFLSKKVWTVRGLVNYFILFAIHVESRRVHLLGMTPNPDGAWTAQQARNLCMHWQDSGADAAYLIHDADSRFTAQFDAILKSESVQPIRLHPATPNMNAYAERWVQSVQTECLDHFVVLGERHLEHILREYLAYYHLERPHQAKGNRPLSAHDSSSETDPSNSSSPRVGRVVCHERLGGLLKHYTRQAA